MLKTLLIYRQSEKSDNFIFNCLKFEFYKVYLYNNKINLILQRNKNEIQKGAKNCITTFIFREEKKR